VELTRLGQFSVATDRRVDSTQVRQRRRERQSGTIIQTLFVPLSIDLD
jgi:hypothetical protein